MNTVYDLISIGAGASGIIASIRAAERGRRVLLLEKSDHPGRKISASGNGRCNLMNTGNLRYYGDQKFASDVFRHISVNALTEYFRHLGLVMTDENEGRRYPLSCQSSSVMDILKNALQLYQVQLMNRSAVTDVEKRNGIFHVLSSDGKCYFSRNVLVSCGGAAQPKLGGSEDGYHILRKQGHTIIPVFPSLVPIITDKRSISGLSGIRTRCRISLFIKSQLIHQEDGEVLFTDYGLSGICIMQCARFVNDDNAYIRINFLHHVFDNEACITDEMKRRRDLYRHFSPVCLLEGILNSKLSYAVMKQAGILLRGEEAGSLSDEDLNRIVYTVCNYQLEVYGTRGFEYAQVTAGGADCSEFSPKTMESKKIHGLYASGEVLNVDGDCGGFNLMFAFASGLLVGNSV